MELEAVGGVSVGDLGLEVGWQVDNADGAEGAFLWADTASNTQTLGEVGDLRLGGDFDTETTTAHDRAGLLALLSTFLCGGSVFCVYSAGIGNDMSSYLWLTLLCRKQQD